MDRTPVSSGIHVCSPVLQWTFFFQGMIPKGNLLDKELRIFLLKYINILTPFYRGNEVSLVGDSMSAASQKAKMMNKWPQKNHSVI